ncbi:discoidin domain-containing protein [Arthrobacter alpinus]|nr:discoidin domain-containing protein [Arthrobacter alpinus]
MKSTWKTIAAVAALSLPLAGIASLSPAAAAPEAPAINPAPMVVPSLHEWTGGAGTVEIKPTSRIVVSAALNQIGEEFSDDLAEMTGLELDVVTGASQPGDISLVLDIADKYATGGERYDAEGYKLDVSAEEVVVTAPTETGAYYGTRSILQIMTQTDGRNKLPVGGAVDWPDYEARGFILDVGRRVFSADFVDDYIKMMSYYKLNRFQIHLNDNQIFVDNGDWRESYMGFRLKSDNPKYAGLASADGSYDRADWDGFEATAASRGVQIIPEIDVPAHAAAIIKWRPDIGLNGGKSDHLDLSKAETTEVIKGMFDEFMPWFQGAEVNFGADEYPGNKAQYRQFYNDMAEHIRATGKQPGAWGSFTEMSKGTGMSGVEGYDKDVIINSWNNGWYGLNAAAADKMKFINTNDGTLYVVPFADYYHGNGLNNQWLYTDWLPNMAGGEVVDPSQIMGSMFAVWNDLVDRDYNEQDVHGLIERSFPVVAQKTWTAKAPKVSYAAFNTALDKVGMGPSLGTIKDTTPAAGAVDLATGKPAAATSTKAGHPASNLTDGDQNTRWESADNKAAALSVDLGSVQKVGGIAAEWAANAPAGYAVETSKDGVFWDRVTTHEVAGAGPDQLTFPTAEARFVRLAGLTPSAGFDTVGAWSLGVQGVTNVAVGAVATASGNEAPSLPANQAFDGNLATRWSANYNGTRWIAGDLGKEQTVNEVTIAWEGASAKDYTVSTSKDGSSWSIVATKTGMPENKRTDVVSFVPVTARHIKVEVQAANMGIYLSAYEIEVRNTDVTGLGITGTLDGEPNVDGIFDVEPTVTLAATGAAAADAVIEYRIGNGTWTAYTAPFAVAGYQPTLVDYRATSGEEAFAGYVSLALNTPGASPSPEPTEPVVTDEPTEPVATDEPTEPVVTDKPTDPVVTDEPTEPVVTDTPTVPAVTDKPTVPATTPAAMANGLASTGANVAMLGLVGMLLLGLGMLTMIRRRSARGGHEG